MTTRYVTLGPLLSGEGSRAFLGLQIVDDVASPCALVWVPEQVLCEPELIERLRRETAHAERLRHPNIARVFGLIEVDEGLARVVEFADGESLRRILDVLIRLPSELAARIVVDAALGVQYAHLTGTPDGTPLVHGDLRPETLLVSYSGITKVTGFGALSVAPKEMRGNRVLGRRSHCAPEQILGGRYTVSPQTDVYLLGALLYEAITGEIPFQGEKDFERAVVTKESLTLKSELVPPKLWPVIRMAMAKKASLRFATAQELGEAVEQALGGLPPRSELADFLESSFATDPTRDARRRELEEGIQEWVVRPGLRLASPTVAMRPQPAAASDGSPAPPETGVTELRPPSVEPALAQAAPTPPVFQGPAPQVERAATGEAPPRTAGTRIAPWAAAGLVALAGVAAALWVTWQKGHPEKAGAMASPESEAAQPAGASPPSAEPNRVGKSPTRKSAEESPRSQKAERAPVPIASSILEVVTEPPLAVSIDGKAVGRSPLKVTVSLGRHRVRLADPELGIELVRSIRAKPGPNQLALKVGTGIVNVSAPAGSEVRIDGRVAGTTPLEKPITVFEGKHRIQVSSGGARWQRPFSVTSGGGVNVEVHFEDQKAP